MMCRKLWFLASMLAVLAGAELGASTRADYTVRLYDDGNLVTTGGVVFSTGNSLIFQYAPDGNSTGLQHFSISNGNGISNNPGTQDFSNLNLGTGAQITASFGSSGGTHTLRIELTQTGFMAPVGNPLVLSSSAGAATGYKATAVGNSIAASFQGFLDNSNTPFGQPVLGATPLSTASATPVNTVSTSPLDFSPATAFNPAVPGGVPFSMTDVFVITFTLAAGSGQDSINLSGTTVASLPAPTGLVLAITALPFLMVGGWAYRRKVKIA